MNYEGHILEIENKLYYVARCIYINGIYTASMVRVQYEKKAYAKTAGYFILVANGKIYEMRKEPTEEIRRQLNNKEIILKSISPMQLTLDHKFQIMNYEFN